VNGRLIVEGTTVWLPKDLVEMVDKIKSLRMDGHRSATVRWLLLKAISDIYPQFLSEDTKKALGLS